MSCTIKGQPVTDIGQRIGLSEKDIEEINKRYQCGNTGGGGGGGTNGKKCLSSFGGKIEPCSQKSYVIDYHLICF